MSARSETSIFTLTIAGAAALLFSIAIGETLLAAALTTWLIWRPCKPNLPSFFVPMCAFIIATLVSLVLSPDPAINWFLRKTILFTMVLLGATFVTTPKRARTSLAILLGVTTITSMVGLIQFAITYLRFLSTQSLSDDPMVLARITGFMGHWLTYSGEQLLVWCAAVPAIVCLGRRWSVPLTIVGAALILSFTQGVWAGAFAGTAVVSLMMPKRTLLKVLLPVGLIALAASGLIYHRLSMSLGDPNFTPRTGRIELLKAGIRMIHEHPWFGVGPEKVSVELASLATYHGHLENDFLQIAAERGLFCFATFIWFLLELYAGLLRLVRDAEPDKRWIALSAIAALSGFLVSGLVEYNFGDSEVQLLMLFIVSIPFGALHERNVKGFG